MSVENSISDKASMVGPEQVVKELTQAFASVQPASAEEALEIPAAPAAQPSVEDMAAFDYQRLIPEFYKKIEELNNRSLKKVVAALVEYPLERSQFKWSYYQEREAFNLGMKLFDCKFVIMRAVLDLKQDEIKKLMAEISTAEDVGTLAPTEGVTNADSVQSGLQSEGPGEVQGSGDGSSDVRPSEQPSGSS